MKRLAICLCLGMACGSAAQAQHTPEAMAERVMHLPVTEPFLRRGLRAQAVDYLFANMDDLVPDSDAGNERLGDLLTEIVDDLLPDARQSLKDDMVDSFGYVVLTAPTFSEFEAFLNVVETEQGSYAFNFLMAGFLDSRAEDDAPVARAMEARRRDLQETKNGD